MRFAPIPMDHATIKARFSQTTRPVVCIQGLGFVGIAMAIAVAAAKDKSGAPAYSVIGVDLPNASGKEKVSEINCGRLPVKANDEHLVTSFHSAIDGGNLVATTDAEAFGLADISVVDVQLDVNLNDIADPKVDFTGFRGAINTLGKYMRAGTLVLVETTVPPGTCEKVVVSELDAALALRGLPAGSLLVAHSYERVMPGRDYFDSIVHFWRVFAGTTTAAADACAQFLSRVIDVANYPLRRLHSTTASETAKVLENSYRATNIAFIEEWGRFAEAVGVDLFEVIDAIRDRPTHNNIRQPGFGVGGYCLSKDPALGVVAARQLLDVPELDFPFCRLAMDANRRMPLVSVDLLRTALSGSLRGKRILLLGVSYRQDIGDTRHSPAEIFLRACEGEGATVSAHDPMLTYWPELDRTIRLEFPPVDGFDAIVFAVAHREYHVHDLVRWLGDARPVVLDANHVLTREQVRVLSNAGHRLVFIGKGN